MKSNILYALAVVVYLAVSLYVVYGFQFKSPSLEFLKLVAILVLTMLALAKYISWLVNGGLTSNGEN
tara:strand:+ start:791 stop:991 length:201 start_codon:yes stop_codon:yes gene_type:complete